MNRNHKARKPIYMEVLHEGPHCIPCEYMAKVVASVAGKFAAVLEWQLVVLTQKDGAARFDELSRQLGRLAPVPSIFINDQLAFETIPGIEELSAFIQDCLQQPP